MIFIICIIFVERQDPLQVLAFNHLVVSCVTKPLGDQGITSVLGIDFTVNWIYLASSTTVSAIFPAILKPNLKAMIKDWT